MLFHSLCSFSSESLSTISQVLTHKQFTIMILHVPIHSHPRLREVLNHKRIYILTLPSGNTSIEVIVVFRGVDKGRREKERIVDRIRWWLPTIHLTRVIWSRLHFDTDIHQRVHRMWSWGCRGEDEFWGGVIAAGFVPSVTMSTASSVTTSVTASLLSGLCVDRWWGAGSEA